MKFFSVLTLMSVLSIAKGQSVANYLPTRSTNVNYSSTSTSGTSFASWRNSGTNTQDDNRSDFTDIGFDFWYNGIRYTQFSVSTNGFLDFSSSDDNGDGTADDFGFSNAAFTAYGAGNATRPAIAPFYDDLTAQGNITALGDALKYSLSGTAPNRTLTVEWINMSVFQNVSPSLNFQVKLVENTGVIIVHYGVMNAGNNTFSYSMGLNGPTMGIFPTASQLKELQTVNSNNFGFTVQNNLSAMPVANSRYVFTPPVPTTVGGNLTASGVAQTAMTLNWTNWAANEVGYVIYNSTDGVNYDFVAQTNANVTSRNITGLLPSTTYYWRVYAVTEGCLSSPLNVTQATSPAGNKISIQTGNWGANNTWSPSGVPTAGDNVTIANGHVVSINVNGQCNNLTVGQGAAATLRFNGNTARTLIINNNVLVNANAVFNVNTSSDENHAIDIGGNITNNGNIDFATDNNSVANASFSKNGNQTITGTGTNNFNTINVDLAGSRENTLEIKSSNFSATAGFLNLISGTLKMSTLNAVNVTPFTTPYTIPAPAGLWMNSSALTLNTINGVVLFGNLTISNGTLNVGNGANKDLEFSGGTITIVNGALNVAGKLDGSDINNPSEFNMNGGTVTVPTVGSTNQNIAPLHISGAGSICNLSGGLIIIQREGGNGNQDLGFTNFGTTNASAVGGTMQIGNASTPAGQTIDINTDSPINNLVVNSANATARLNTYPLSIKNNITITAGSLNSNNLGLTLGGNWSNAGTFIPGTSSVNFDSGLAQTIFKSGGETFNNLSFSGAGTKTFLAPITTLGDVNINSGANVDVNASNFQFTLKKSFVNNGTFTSRQGLVLLNGTTNQTIGGSSVTDFFNLTLNNTTGAILTGAERLQGTLNLNNGNLNLNSQQFTMVSTATATARIAQITGNGDITGNVTVQRYMPGGATGWALIGNPTSSSLTFAQWDDDLIITCPTCPDGTAAGFTSIYSYNEPATGLYDSPASYVAINNITDPIQNTKGYWVYLGNSQYTTTAITLDFTGGVKKFNNSIPLAYTNTGSSANDGWNLIFNPYPSPISWNALRGATANLDNSIYVYNADLNSGTGGFASFVNGVSSPAINAGGVGDEIAMSQGFYVHSTGATALNATESNKVASTQAFLKPSNGNTSPLLRINMNGPYSFLDETVLYFDAGATTNFDNNFDAIKMRGQDPYAPSIALETGTDVFQINGIAPVNGTYTSDLKTLTGYTGTYTIGITNENSFPYSACIALYDKYTNITTDLRTSSYVFDLEDTTTVARFTISITMNQLNLSSTLQQPSCQMANAGKVIATGSGSGPWNYYWTSNGTVVQTRLNKNTSDTIINLSGGAFDLEMNTVGMCDYGQASFIINSQEPITSGFSSQDTVLLSSATPVQFNNTTSNAVATEWDFGTGNDFSSLQSPQFLYNSAGVYTVSLIATSTSGCKDTSSKRIVIMDDVTTSISKTEGLNQFRLKTFDNNQFAIDAVFTGHDIFDSQLMDLQGRLLTNFEKQSGSTYTLKLDMSGYTPGIYLLSIQSNTYKKVLKLNVH